MNEISIYLEFWEYLLDFGLKIIQTIDLNQAWDYRIFQTEFTILETFNHIVQAIYEDAGTWFLKDSKKFIPSDNQKNDFYRSINRMVKTIKDFTNEKLDEKLTFQWGETTTIRNAIKQNIFHAISHFGQLKERVGILQRTR